MRFNTAFTILLIISESAFAKDDGKDLTETCSPIQANIHDPLRCRERANGEEFILDGDCCAGSDKSPAPGLCANGFNRTEKGVCGQDHPWCREHECRHYTCQKSTSCLDYVGCFNDRVDAREFRFKAAKQLSKGGSDTNRFLNTISACMNYCRKEKFSFAALQGAGTCFCGDAYGKYGNADERFCGKKEGKAVALRCGDGDEGTCAGVNAVYRVAGKQSCCEYHDEHPVEKKDLGWIFWVIFGPVAAFIAIILFGVVPSCVGVCIWLAAKKKKRAQAARVAADSDVTNVQPANVAAVSVTVLDPATQKTDAMTATPVVVMPTSVVVASEQPASIYPTL